MGWLSRIMRLIKGQVLIKDGLGNACDQMIIGNDQEKDRESFSKTEKQIK